MHITTPRREFKAPGDHEFVFAVRQRRAMDAEVHRYFDNESAPHNSCEVLQGPERDKPVVAADRVGLAADTTVPGRE